jgi:outer membrane protein assembly factor BamD (BamD/ComL family)
MARSFWIWAGPRCSQNSQSKRCKEHHGTTNDREVLYALVYFNRDRGNINAAKQYAEKLIELFPSDSDAHRLLDELK